MSEMRPCYDPRRNGHSPLELSLALLSDVTMAGLRIVPSVPSREMIAAALRAGVACEEDAIRIYRSMIRAES